MSAFRLVTDDPTELAVLEEKSELMISLRDRIEGSGIPTWRWASDYDTSVEVIMNILEGQISDLDLNILKELDRAAD